MTSMSEFKPRDPDKPLGWGWIIAISLFFVGVIALMIFIDNGWTWN